ncbi:MAG: hypothetical protein N3A69_17525, partial [Leptospiraceae bacterium]|nr:hypothetical protein [Leptospiraceae bacterium]
MEDLQFSYSFIFILLIFIPLVLFFHYQLILNQSLRYAPIQHTPPKKSLISLYILLTIEGLLLVFSILVSADPHRVQTQN